MSIVVVTYDNAAEIVSCLEALTSQRSHLPTEIIVVDNGSHDGTPRLVRRQFPDLCVVEQANLGFGAGNNRGVREATGDILLFVNPDAVAEPGFVEAMAAAVGPSQAATAQVVLKQEPGRLNTAGHRLHFTGFGFLMHYNEPRLPGGPSIPVPGVSGAAFAILREDFLRLGGFDEDFFLYMEDTELSWRMNRAGFRIVLVPDAVVTHDYASGFPSQKVDYLETGRLLLLRKHLPWWLWIAYLPGLAMGEGLAWGRAAWMGKAGLAAKWRGTRSGWRRAIRRYPDLPRARPHLFAARTMPFTMLSKRPIVKWGGAVFNAFFLLNTWTWWFRRPK